MCLQQMTRTAACRSTAMSVRAWLKCMQLTNRKRKSRRKEKTEALAKYKQQLKDANIVIQRPKSNKLRWQKREAARAAAEE